MLLNDKLEIIWKEFNRRTPPIFWEVYSWRDEGTVFGELDVAERKRVVQEIARFVIDEATWNPPKEPPVRVSSPPERRGRFENITEI